MSDDSSTDALVAGALFVGGGLAGYFINPPPTPTGAAPVSSPEQVDDAAPVSSPDQVAAPSPQPRGSLPRTFDPLFEKYRAGIPIEFLRALAMRESGMKPTIKGKGGAAWGLLQITEAVRGDFNHANGTSYSREQLLQPAVNIAIGCWLLRLIADAYQKRHGDMRNMRTDWLNPRAVELLVYGWNAGFSSSGGVMRVVAKLKELGARDVDIDLVAQNAGHLGGGKHLREPARVAWAKSVAALYLRERALYTVLRNAPFPFGDPIKLWDELCAYFIERRSAAREASARGWVYPLTTRAEVGQAAMLLDIQIDRRAVTPELHAVLERWRAWKVALHAEMKTATASPDAVYPMNEMFWLDLSYQLAAALSRAPKTYASDDDGGALGFLKGAGGWVWDHKRWLWPVPGVAAGLELVTGGTPELADFVPGLDLAGRAAGAVADGAKNAASDAADWLIKPLLIGAGALGGLVVLTTVLRD